MAASRIAKAHARLRFFSAALFLDGPAIALRERAHVCHMLAKHSHFKLLFKPQRPGSRRSGFPPGNAQEDAPIARWAFLFLVSLNTSTGFCSWHPVCLTPYRPRGWTLSVGTFFCWCHISFVCFPASAVLSRLPLAY